MRACKRDDVGDDRRGLRYTCRSKKTKRQEAQRSQGGYLKVRIKTKTQENKMGTIRHTFEEIALRGHFITAEL